MEKIEICSSALDKIKLDFDPIITDQRRLRQVSVAATKEHVIELHLIERLKISNGLGWVPGCGLAAIQIGIPLRFAWFKWGEEEFTLLNSEIVEYGGKCKPVEEGCMSIPDKKVMVPRWYKIKYTNDGVMQTAKGLKAHIIQHEIDHMNGILNIDKAVTISRHVKRGS